MKGTSDLRQAVRRVFGATGRFDLDPVSAEQDNRAWYVAHAEGRCIAKLPERRGGLTIRPELEYELLQLAAEAGVAPRPLAHDPATEIVFIEEIEGSTTLTEQQACESEWIARVGESLQALHTLPVPEALRVFDPVAFAEVYCGEIRGTVARRARALRVECEQLTEECAVVLSGTCLCHNDLHAGNVLVSETLWLVDFEYAVQAAPIVDVASYVAYNDLAAAAALSLAQACLGDDLPFSTAQLQAVVRIQRILGELWEIARSDNNAVS